MGFFNFFELSSPRTRPFLEYLPAPVATFFTAPKAVEHDLSFDLTTSYPPRKMPIRRIMRSPTPVHMPLEVVLSIIEAAYYDEDLEANDALLKNCSLVCKSWSIPAQKLLFSRATIRTQRAYQAFQDAVDRSTERGRMLGNAVVRMRVVLDHNQPYGLSQRSFAHAVTLCPNLYELNLALYGCAAPGEDIVGIPAESRMRRPAPSFDEQTLALLKSGPRITALQFSNWSENQHSVNQLLDVWPTLKSLVISGTPPKLPAASSKPFACALDELRMNFQTPPSVDFMKWLLHNSAHSLRILELEREPSAHLLEYLVDAHGATLHSLALPACGSHEHALAVQKCNELRELKLEGSWASPMVFRKLPEVVQHIALGLDQDTALQPVLEVVKSKDSLKVVTVHIWDGGDQHPQLSALKIACAYHGVELRMTKDIGVFRSMIVCFFLAELVSNPDHAFFIMIEGRPYSSTNFPSYQDLRESSYHALLIIYVLYHRKAHDNMTFHFTAHHSSARNTRSPRDFDNDHSCTSPSASYPIIVFDFSHIISPMRFNHCHLPHYYHHRRHRHHLTPDLSFHSIHPHADIITTA